ncbi:MAG: GAF domain-containing protein [Actinomycetota bacterium]|nr:GAF domain-containing protein [Actinomycetota bacterium]
MTDVGSALQAPERVAAVQRILIELPSGGVLDRLTALAAELLECPMAMLTLLEADRQRFVSSHGLPPEVRQVGQTALDYCICQHAVATRRPLVVGDTTIDPVLATNLAVTALGVRAYAGIPLITSGGHALGTLCVLDVARRQWRNDHLALLSDLAGIVVDELRRVTPNLSHLA